jgi:hypothetical protein
MNTEMHCDNVVCDVHLKDMTFATVRYSHGILITVKDGFAACPVNGCNRFYGTEGYCDLTEDAEYSNVRLQPCCEAGHLSKPMYVQRTSQSLQWVCPICGATAPYQT